MQKNRNRLPDIAVLEAVARQALQNGKEQEAIRAWGQILDQDPNHVRTLTALGQHSFRKGDMQSARVAFQRVVNVSGADPQQWINLALACQGLKDEPGEEAAIKGALTTDPGDLLGLVLRGNLLERQGKSHQAASAYGAVTTVSPPIEQLSPELRPAVIHAMSFQDRYNKECATFIDAYLEPHYKEFSGERLARFRQSIDIMVGRKRRFDSMPLLHYYPGLPAIEFFERADFPWLDGFEASTDAIRDEFLNVLATEQGFTPYITYPDDVPLNQWAELNNSPQWSAFHLIKAGNQVLDNAAKCPLTMSLLETAPQPVQTGRTPAAMFSLLKPKTRIPPHTGSSNVRLVTHVPLIIPQGCGFRVGNDTREWVPGKAWVFDDTIQHEAWNDSDKLRVVLIFDIWHPHLTPPERALISAMTAGMDAFAGSAAGFEL
jgi:tetratricopeptide (TPR) repeat protein